MVDWRDKGAVQPLLLTAKPVSKGYELFVLSAANEHMHRDANRALRGGAPWQMGTLAPGQQVTLQRGDREISLNLKWASEAGRAETSNLWTHWTSLAVLLDQSPANPGEFAIPRGSCSMDTGPQDAVPKYPETCFEAGRIGCFLDFQIRIMGDLFNRVAWSSYGEAAHKTQATRLVTAGLDMQRLVRGLLVRYAPVMARRREFGTEKYQPLVLGVANDPKVDEYNRFRAAQGPSLYESRPRTCSGRRG